MVLKNRWGEKMLINKILNILLRIADFILLIPSLILINLTALLAWLTGGIILLLLDLIWALFFLLPMLGLSWVYNKVPFLRVPIAIIGFPIALLGYIYISSITHMGEVRPKVLKMFLCISWPFSLDAWLCDAGKLDDEARYERIRRIAEQNRMRDLMERVGKKQGEQGEPFF